MKVSICVIAKNEESYLPGVLEDIQNQDYPHKNVEVILIDGMSTDKTKQIMKAFQENASDFLSVQVLDNPKVIQASGWNVGIQAFTTDVFIRVDAHAKIPKNFIRANVEVLESGEMVSGGPRFSLIKSDSPWRRTLLLAERSSFGSGIASYRRETKKMYVNSLFHGAYKREVLEKVKGFNESLGRTEDNEFHYRIREAGYKLCYSPTITSYQYARRDLKGMLKQKFGNGYWVILTLKVCPQCISIYHLVPFAFVLGIILTTLLALFHKPMLMILMWSLYVLMTIFMSITAVKGEKKHLSQILLPGLFLLQHISYGIGSAVGAIYYPFWHPVKKGQV